MHPPFPIVFPAASHRQCKMCQSKWKIYIQWHSQPTTWKMIDGGVLFCISELIFFFSCTSSSCQDFMGVGTEEWGVMSKQVFFCWKHLRGWLERLIWYCLYFILMFSHTCNTHLYTDTHVRMQANACEFVLNWKLECWENIYSCSDCSKNVVLSRNR